MEHSITIHKYKIIAENTINIHLMSAPEERNLEDKYITIISSQRLSFFLFLARAFCHFFLDANLLFGFNFSSGENLKLGSLI
jgi:hypothetical protein